MDTSPITQSCPLSIQIGLGPWLVYHRPYRGPVVHVQCPNVSHHPTVEDNHHQQRLGMVMWNKSPKQDIYQPLKQMKVADLSCMPKFHLGRSAKDAKNPVVRRERWKERWGSSYSQQIFLTQWGAVGSYFEFPNHLKAEVSKMLRLSHGIYILLYLYM